MPSSELFYWVEIGTGGAFKYCCGHWWEGGGLEVKKVISTGIDAEKECMCIRNSG